MRKNKKSGRLRTEQKEGKLKQWDKSKPDSSNSCVRLGYRGYKLQAGQDTPEVMILTRSINRCCLFECGHPCDLR